MGVSREIKTVPEEQRKLREAAASEGSKRSSKEASRSEVDKLDTTGRWSWVWLIMRQSVPRMVSNVITRGRTRVNVDPAPQPGPVGKGCSRVVSRNWMPCGQEGQVFLISVPQSLEGSATSL